MRIICALIVCIVMISSVGSADTVNVSSMSFDELSALKKAVDTEYASRPESNGILLTTGVYIVGKDIKPGRYNAAMTIPDENENSFVCIYDDYKTYSKEEPYCYNLAKYNKYFFLYEDATSLMLEENNVVVVSRGSILLKTSEFKPTDYYSYEAPAGTLVPRGKYTVGKDIPAGRYNIYPGSVKGGQFRAYSIMTINGSMQEVNKLTNYYTINVNIKKDIECVSLELEDNDIIDVTESIIMSKKSKLQFDD